MALGVVVGGTACSDAAPPAPEVADIVLSVADTAIRFREPLVITAIPQGALGVPVTEGVTWTSLSPDVLSVQPLSETDHSAQIRATGVGTGQVRASAGNITRSLQVTVQDTVFSVTVTPGALSLVAGDTVSFTAVVSAPPDADKTIRWDLTNAATLQSLPSTNPLVLRIQARTTGSAIVRATALADTTKTASSPITSQIGRLVFVVPPSNTSREIPFNPRVVVAVQDASGNTSARAANAITLGTSGGSCTTQLRGASTVIAKNGTAVFEDVVPSERCPSLTISAAADPVAAVTVSQPIVVAARSCDVAAPLTVGVATTTTFEAGDCVVERNGQSYLSHSYLVKVPVLAAVGAFSFSVSTGGVAPRIESFLWPPYSVFLTDSTLANWYVHAPGTLRISIISTSAGPYILGSQLETFLLGGGPCRIGLQRGITTNTRATCQYAMQSLPGAGVGRSFIVYAPPGLATTITARGNVDGSGNPYLEVFDLTNPSSPVLIASDDNSGGGTDAQVRLDAVLNGRFLEVRPLFPAGRVAGPVILTISP
jgi:hypothetical protein